MVGARYRRSGAKGKTSTKEIKDAIPTSWEAITPPELLRAVLHIRDSFEQAASWHLEMSQDRYFRHLQSDREGLTEFLEFDEHLSGCFSELNVLVRETFPRFLKISLVQGRRIKCGPVEWAEFQVSSLIGSLSNRVDEWIRCSFCGPVGDSPRAGDPISDWRAPDWFLEAYQSAQNGPSIAPEVCDHESTMRVVSALRNTNLASLKSTLAHLAGDTSELLAQKQFKELSVSGPLASTGMVEGKVVGVTSDRPLRFRSQLRRAIALILTASPRASDREIAERLDEDGGVELPKNLRGNGTRSFVEAYNNTSTAKSLERTFSKTRREMRERGLL